jgi:site-specific DNA-cytosine methylase
MLWFTKSRRAQNVDDYETWIEGGVMPTLNAFDNGDVRTTVIVFHPHYHDGARVQGDTMNTLTSRMGTGGNNVSMVAVVPIHDKATRFAGKRQMHDGTYSMDGAGNGLGIGKEGDPMNTLTGGDRHAVFERTNVRRLTPVECERLQGFPDDWTAGQSDSHRYKQMGNAVAVPVVEWIVQGIVDVAKVS